MQIIVLIIVLALAAVGYMYLKKTEKRKNISADAEELGQKTAQAFVNAKDVGENVLYTIDGNMFAFINIEGLCLELYSQSEQITICRMCSSSLSKFRYPFKYLSVSRPVDVSKTMRQYSELVREAEGGRRALLKLDMEELAEMVMSGETLERQHYIVIWNNSENEGEAELVKRAKALAKIFSDSGIAAEILDKKGIVKLCNLVNIPAYVHIEAVDIETTFTALKEA